MKVLVIDVQKGITDERLFNFEGFIQNTQKIIDTARKNNVEVIYVQHDDGPGTGFSIGDRDFEIADQVAPQSGEKIFYKTINTCFGNKELVEYLESSTKDNTLMVIGLQTNFCIDATVKSAFERGYTVIIPEGTNSTFDNDYMDRETTYKYYNNMMWPERFAQCVSMDAAVEMLRKAKP
ncbi:cysteine hydrolase family protein [Butyrivibrio proteoclasticus]|uniref:cysteine hydrolase family protein n=1 Tax=Butyrivibrio proteoclasticus TaxID=43305 RepID=UPI000479DE13|nr:cysteine hydrolase family protein [Butyrivibrio proteoclasticus]